MKRYTILTMMLLTLGTISMQAQTIIGARIGGNIGMASIDGLSGVITPDLKSLNTFTGGIYLNQRIDDNLSFTSGVHFKRKGFIAEETVGVKVFGVELPVGGSAETRLNYIEIPLLLNYTFNKTAKVRPYLEVGPAISYAIDAEIQPRGKLIVEFNLPKIDLDLSKDIYNRFEIGAQGVAGIKIPYGKGEFDLGLSYTHAFTEMLNDPILDVKLKNRGIGFHAGFGINI